MIPSENETPKNPTAPDFSQPAPQEQAQGPASGSSESSREIPKPVIGYCRGTGKPLTAEQATYVNGVLYSKEYASAHKIVPEPASPYAGGPTPPLSNPEVSPGWAFVLGLIPGVGAIYNQQYAKGLFHIVVLGLLVTLLERVHGSGNAFLGMMLAGWFLYMPFEAYHTAKRRQAGLAADEFSGFVETPANFKRFPAGPILLIVAGCVFLLDNLGLLHLEELLRYWPILLIMAGAYLLIERVQGVPTANPQEERRVE